jgi:hypothetical protein
MDTRAIMLDISMTASTWIDIADRLPELGKPVLCAVYNPGRPIKVYKVEIYYLFERNDLGTTFTFHDGSEDDKFGFTHFVSHWMELPELPMLPREIDGRNDLTKDQEQYIKNKQCPLRNSHKFIDQMRAFGRQTIIPSYEDPDSIWYGKKNYE